MTTQDKQIMKLITDTDKVVKKVGRPRGKSEKEELDEKKQELKGLFKRQGRHKKYTPVRLRNKIVEYFAKCEQKGTPPTVTGLTVHLKISRETFYSYAREEETKDILETARYLLENWLEERLVMARHNPTGIIFALKNRFGWKDVQTVETNTSDVSEEELLAKIAALAPKLLEALGDTPKLEDKSIVEAEVIDESIR